MATHRNFMALDWEGAGYHGFPAAPAPRGYASIQEAEARQGFEQALASAKQGDFSVASSLLAVYDEADWMLAAACSDAAGDT